MPATMEATKLEEKLNAFDDAIKHHEYLEIDGDVEMEGEALPVIKVLNHKRENASGVTLDAIKNQKLECIIKALETGISLRVFGVTRIVGYYSRVNNWNGSKRAELTDRHQGSYKLRECEGLDTTLK